MSADSTEKQTTASITTSAWCVVGGGNMAQAIVRGATASGQIEPDRFVIVEPDHAKRAAFASRGVKARANVTEAASLLAAIEPGRGHGHFILAVKPQVFPQVAPELRALLDTLPRRVVSIMAGLPSTQIEAALGPNARVLRLMPNTPAQIRMSTTSWARGVSAKLGDEIETTALFATLGMTIELEERLFDAFTAVAGSGPAYLFYLAEAMVNAAKNEGIDAEASARIVRSVLVGSSELLRTSPTIAPSELRKHVSSKGGTTEAAIHVLDESGVLNAIERAIGAATSRGKMLASGKPAT
ncbi:MAG: pyrroline-5-carboxylate reductase [Phycisphaerales bacterium]